MNAALTAIKTKVTNFIRNKAIVSPDPAKIKAVDHAGIFDDILTYLDTNTSPPSPVGVSFSNAPGTPVITGTTIAMSSSVVNNAGTSKSVAAQNLTFAYSAAGKVRKDAIVVNYLLTTAVYERVIGPEVTVGTGVTTPTIPDNRLFVAYVDITDSAGTQAPSAAILSIDQEGTITYPDASGKATLPASVTTARTISINGVSQSLAANREYYTAMGNTGVLTYAGATSASTTQINIGAVTGIIVNNETAPGTPTYTKISYAGATNVTVTTLGTGTVTYILLNSSATIVFQNTFPTSAQRKTSIYLGKVAHPLNVVQAVINEPDFIISPLQQVRDWMQGINYINQGVSVYPNGANLQLNNTAGTVIGDGINFVTDKTNPNTLTIAGGTGITFQYRNQAPITNTNTTVVDPANYDIAGVTTAIPGGSGVATIQYVFAVPGGVGLRIQRGQTVYSSLSAAIAAVGKEVFVVNPNFTKDALLIGVIVLTKSCTNLSDSTNCVILNADKFGQTGGASGGISTATSQSAYNNSSQPIVLTNSTLGAWTVKRGSAADTNNVFAVQNGAGANTLTVTGAGVTNAVELQESGVSLAAKYAGIKSTLRIRPTDITASYSLTQSEWDAYDMFIINSSSSVIITLSTGTDIAGRQAVFYQAGTGTFTFQAGSGATINQMENKFTSYAQKASVSVIARSNTSFIIVGQTKI